MQWFNYFLQEAIAPYYTVIVAGLLILLTVYWMFRYGFRVFNPLNKDLKMLNKFLLSLDNDVNENLESLSQYFRGNINRSLKNVWGRFSSDLEHTSGEMEVEEYFNTIHLIQIPASRKKAEAKSSIIMTMGFLAGFSRLILTMRGEEFSVNQSQLIIGLIGEIVLITIIGIILSIIYQTVDKHLYQTAVNETYLLQSNLKRRISLPKDTVQFSKVAASIDTLTQNLNSYARDTADEQHETLEKLVSIFLDRLDNGMSGQFQTLGRTIEEMSATQLRSKDQVESLIDNMAKGAEQQKNINKATEAIVTAIAEHERQITESSHNLSGSLGSIRDLTTSLTEVLAFNREALAGVRDEKERMKEEYNEYFNAISDQIQKFQKETGVELEKVLTRFADVSGKSFDRLENSVIKSMDVWSNANKTMLQSMEVQSKTMVSVSKEMTQRLNELSGQLETSMKDFTSAVHSGTVQTLSEFDNGLGEITERLGKTITDIRDAIDDLPAAIETLRKNIS